MPNPGNPQNLNRFGYVLNNPVNLVDPSGHICTNPEDADSGISSSNCDKADKPLGARSGFTGGGITSVPTPTTTPNPSTNTPVPTPTSSLKENAINLIQQSRIGKPLYEWAITNGVNIEYNNNNGECKGYSQGKNIYLNRCTNSDVYAAGQIGHETLHIIYNLHYTRSQEEEYLAYMVGDVIRAELIAQGYGTGTRSDYFALLTEYTVQFENNSNLEVDLENWFINHNIEVYVNPPNAISGSPTGWGVAPFPLTYTPRP